MTCVSEEVLDWVKASSNAQVLIDRVRSVVAKLPDGCRAELSRDTGVPYPALRQFADGATKRTNLVYFSAIVGWIAPGHRVTITPGMDLPEACDLSLPVMPVHERKVTLKLPVEDWRPAPSFPGFEWEYRAGKPTGGCRKALMQSA